MRLYKILFLILVCLCTLKTYVQGQSHYEVLHSASGLIVSSNDQDQIDQAVQRLIDRLPVGIQSQFKVYSADFYLHQQVYPGSYPNVFSDLVNELTSPYYIIIAKGIVLNSDVAEWYVELKLPEGGDFACLNNSDFNALRHLLNVTSNKCSASSGSHALGIISTLDKLEHYVNIIVNCNCDFSDPECAKSLFERNDDFLLGMGFRKIQVKLGSSNYLWNQGTHNIYDYTGDTNGRQGIIINNQEYYIPDELEEGKVILDQSEIIVADSSYNISLVGSVFIFDENSFQDTALWNAAVSMANQHDYVEYWVLLYSQKDNNYYLYSRFTLGPLVPPGQAIWEDYDADTRAAFLIRPLLKVLKNTAIDAFFQCLVNWILHPNVKSLDDAINSINWKAALANGLSGLIPWSSEDAWKIKIGKSFLSSSMNAFAIVLDNSNKNENYTASEALGDFVSYCGMGVGLSLLFTHPSLASASMVVKRAGLYKMYVYTKNYPKVRKVVRAIFSDQIVTQNAKVNNLSVSHSNDWLPSEYVDGNDISNKIRASNLLNQGLPVPSSIKDFWKAHENHCNVYLKNHYNNKVGRSIYADVTLNDGKKFTVIFDDVSFANNKFKIWEAKSSYKKNLYDEDIASLIRNFATANQKRLYDALQKGDVKNIKPKGAQAKKFRDEVLEFNDRQYFDNFFKNIERELTFLVTDLPGEGYNIYSKSFKF
jgi:hypothetical protein